MSKNDIRYYGFKYIFLNEQTFQLMKMIKVLDYKSVQVIMGVSRDLFKVFEEPGYRYTNFLFNIRL